jgi:hypothetical protein
MCAASSSTVILMDASSQDNATRNAVEVAARSAERGASVYINNQNVEIILMEHLDEFRNSNAWHQVLRARNLILVGSYDAQGRPSIHFRRLLEQGNIPFLRHAKVGCLGIIPPACCSCGCDDNKLSVRSWAAKNSLQWETEAYYAPNNLQNGLDAWKSICVSVGTIIAS